MTIARLQAFRRILLSLFQSADRSQMRGLLALLRMVEAELETRGALRDMADLRPLAHRGTLTPDE